MYSTNLNYWYLHTCKRNWRPDNQHKHECFIEFWKDSIASSANLHNNLYINDDCIRRVNFTSKSCLSTEFNSL